MGFVGWASGQTTTGVMSPPTVATSIQNNPKLGFSFGPHFYAKSFYMTPYCRDYVQVSMTGYMMVGD